nr:hypothetical protein [Tanacetum cinerariifolium]
MTEKVNEIVPEERVKVPAGMGKHCHMGCWESALVLFRCARMYMKGCGERAWSENIRQKKEEEEKQIAEEQAAKARYWKIPICYDDNKDYTIAITPKEPDNSLSMRDEHLDTILIDPHHFNAESDLIESLLNQDSSIISSSLKIDYLLDEFVGELIFLKSIPLGIDKADCDPEEEIHLIEKSLYDNSSPRPTKEFNSENSDAIIESFSPSSILVEDNSEGDNLFLERLLQDDHIPLPDILDFSNVVRVFLPFFTYPVTSLILLSSGSEDTIFDPSISNYHFSSLEPGMLQIGIRAKWVSDAKPQSAKAASQSLEQAPPSPDYVPSLENPSSPDYVPGPEYLEYVAPSKDDIPVKDQPLPADASPTALSPGYIVDSDPSEKDSEEDPEKDPADYPTNRGDDDEDEEESFEDDDEEDDEVFEEDEEKEEEHLAPADLATLPVINLVPSAEKTKPFETDESAPIPPPPRSPQTRRAASPSTHHPLLPSEIPSTPLLLPSTAHKYDILEVDMPLWKRARFTTPTSRAMTVMGEVNRRVTDLVTTHNQDAQELYKMPPKRTTPMSDAAIKALVWLAHWQNMKQTEAEMEMTAMIRELAEEGSAYFSCTVGNQVKYATCTLLGNALTWWNSHVKTVGHDVAYGVPWKTLMKIMTDKYYPRGVGLLCGRMFPKVSNEVEKYVEGLPDMIQGSVMASKPKTMQEAIETANYLMDQKCAPKRNNYKKVGYLARGCRSPATNVNNQRAPGAIKKVFTFFECGV